MTSTTQAKTCLLTRQYPIACKNKNMWRILSPLWWKVVCPLSILIERRFCCRTSCAITHRVWALPCHSERFCTFWQRLIYSMGRDHNRNISQIVAPVALLPHLSTLKIASLKSCLCYSAVGGSTSTCLLSSSASIGVGSSVKMGSSLETGSSFWIPDGLVNMHVPLCNKLFTAQLLIWVAC